MKLVELQTILLRGESRFSIAFDELKLKLGEPAAIRFLPDALQRGPHKIAALTYAFDDGEADIYCPIELRQGAQWIVDGWILASPQTRGEIGISPALSRGLFEAQDSSAKIRPDPAPLPPSKKEWKSGRQRHFGDDA